ncbi:aminotransferase A [Evansella cellulosilytica]|uniref:Aminotransferase n=1 Tax=Evansella cellulosilytica (strain ATCC 21833 / DSM 2522 / FERM P-1141 / JCM 9156 / N-4) TaxID=649639 RepID=E6U0A2_EVAC2|nr:aminotransferase A [Evansella cellulosilytica]ADU30218.1 aminotransferase class I and II [Evansella cellulosilytica DSM 2522]
MENLINHRVRSIEISGIRQFFNKVATVPDAVQLTLGQPDFYTPDHIKKAAISAINDNKTTYTKNAGEDSLVEAASQFLHKKYQLYYDPKTEVLTTIGASQALDVAFRTILEPNTEVILPGPVYPAYAPIITLCGAKPIFVDTRDSNFILTPELIEKHKTDRTRAVILPYPSNPTGVVLSREQAEALANYLKEQPLFVVSDEIYSELNYDHEHVSIAQFPRMKEKTIVINGVSKSHSMTGWRIGFAFAPAYLIKHMVKVHQYNVSCASSISQHAAIEALTNGINDALPMKEKYKERRDYVLARLKTIGIPTIKPSGAFYVFPDISQMKLSSYEFAVKLLQEEKLAVVPGDAFSSLGEGYIRISYAYSHVELEDALNRLERFWTNHVK